MKQQSYPFQSGRHPGSLPRAVTHDRLTVTRRGMSALIQVLILVSLLGGVLRGQATGAEPIFQFGGRAFLDADLLSALDELEAEAVQEVIEQHQLPASDLSRASRVLDYARSDVRARLFAKVLEIAALEPDLRTANQQLIAEAYADKLQEQRIAAVESAISEYERWESSPCDYVPPEPFTYDPDPGGTLCDGNFTLSDLLQNVSSPTLEEFLAYGALEVRQSLLDDEGAIVVAETQGAMVGYSVLIASGVAIVGAVALGALVAFGGESLFLIGVGGAAAAGASATVATAAIVASVIGAIGVALVAIFIGVMQGIFVFTTSAIPDQLAEALVQAQDVRPHLNEVVATGEGVQELFYAFIPTTLPEFRSTEPPPALDNLDQCFAITDESGNTTITHTMSYPSWPVSQDDTIEDVLRWTTGLSKGWFVSETVSDDQTFSTRSLLIQYISGEDGLPWGA
jgi:hypothetical protein